jgi:histidinol-phosphate aminotransferase
VLLRDRSTDPGCDGFVRITIGVQDHVERGLAALKDALREIDWKPIAAHDDEAVLAGEREYE